jgi:Fe-S-cluster containining protein
VTAAAVFDCQACGACCVNPAENRRQGFRDWVEIDERDAILSRRRADKLIVYNAAGEPHMRLDGEGRCVALRGRLGERVWCSVYELRPRACRRVEPGDDRCRRYRAERGIG